MMNRILLIFFLTIFSLESYARISCGTFLLTGKYINREDKLVYVVFEKTEDEHVFEIHKKDDLIKMAAVLNGETQIKTNIVKIDGMNGTLENISDIKLVVPDPLMLNSADRIKNLKVRTCKK